MARRPNQKSVYFSWDVEKAMQEFNERYPAPRLTDIVNAALREYLKLASEKGIDGNLRPICCLENEKSTS